MADSTVPAETAENTSGLRFLPDGADCRDIFDSERLAVKAWVRTAVLDSVAPVPIPVVEVRPGTSANDKFVACLPSTFAKVLRTLSLEG